MAAVQGGQNRTLVGRHLIEERLIAVDADDGQGQRIIGQEWLEGRVNRAEELAVPFIPNRRHIDAEAARQGGLAAGAFVGHGEPAGLNFDEGVARALVQACWLLAQHEHPIARRPVHGKDEVTREKVLGDHNAFRECERQVILGVEVLVHIHHQAIQRVAVIDVFAQLVKAIQQRRDFAVAEFLTQALLRLCNQVSHPDRVLKIVGCGAMGRQRNGQRWVTAGLLYDLNIMTIHKTGPFWFL